MAPEPVQIAAADVRLWLDFAKAIVPPTITGIVVIAVARLTYQYANKGRKEDILYKERYKGFEAISSYAHSMEFKIDRLESDLISYMGKSYEYDEDRLDYIIELASEYHRLFSDPETEVPNMTNTALMRKETRSEFIQLTQLHRELATILYWHTLESYYRDYPMAIEPKEIKAEIMSYIVSCRKSIERLTKLAFEDIDLPER